MSAAWALVLILISAGLAAVLLLLLRRRAPEEGFFNDSDRAAGVFGVLATAFFLVAGFVVFLAFTVYDESRSGAETEALMVFQLVETAQLLPEAVRSELTGELVCYGRTVVGQEWPQMESGDDPRSVNPWGVALFRSFEALEPRTAAQEAAYAKWLEQTSTREEARLDRLHGAEGIIPLPVWVALFLSAGLITVFFLFFADPGERAGIQVLQIASVVAVMATLLVLLGFLNTPFREDLGGIEPTAMERTLATIDEALTALGRDIAIPCSATGEPS